MLPILLACLIWLPGTIGFGWFILCLHEEAVRFRPLFQLALSGLLGLAALSVIGSFANFFIGVYPWMPILALVAGWMICGLQWRRLFYQIRPSHLNSALILVVIISLLGSRGKIQYDTGLYHLAAVKWIALNPTPLGLANLYGRLGFNSAWFSTAAMLETPFLVERSTFVLNPLLFVIFGLAIGDAAVQLIERGLNRANLFLLLAAYPWAAYGFYLSSSLHPDWVVMLLTCLVFFLWLNDEHWALAITLSVFAVTIKLSAIPLFIAAIIFWLRRGLKSAPGAVVLLWSITLAVWLTRGIVLSGCLFYPSIVGRIRTLSWTVPIARIQVESACIADWAKYRLLPWNVPAGASWLGSWSHRMLAMQEIWVAISLLLLGILLMVIRGTALGGRRLLAVLLASFGGIVFWFVAAPEPRFGYGYIFCFAALIFCAGLENVRLPSWTIKLAGFSGVILLVILSGIFQQLNHIRWAEWPGIKNDAVMARRIMGGPTVYVPKVADQIWSSPLPSTPYPDPQLRCTVDERGRFRRFWLDSSQAPMRVP